MIFLFVLSVIEIFFSFNILKVLLLFFSFYLFYWSVTFIVFFYTLTLRLFKFTYEFKYLFCFCFSLPFDYRLLVWLCNVTSNHVYNYNNDIKFKFNCCSAIIYFVSMMLAIRVTFNQIVLKWLKLILTGWLEGKMWLYFDLYLVVGRCYQDLCYVAMKLLLQLSWRGLNLKYIFKKFLLLLICIDL